MTNNIQLLPLEKLAEEKYCNKNTSRLLQEPTA